MMSPGKEGQISFNKETFGVFTCEEVFEPPVITVRDSGTSSDDIPRLKPQKVSFPGFRPPGEEKERTIGTSVVATFLAATQDLFVSPTEGVALYRAMIDRLETVPRSAETELCKRWAASRGPFLMELFTSSPRGTRMANAIADLLAYYEENVL